MKTAAQSATFAFAFLIGYRVIYTSHILKQLGVHQDPVELMGIIVGGAIIPAVLWIIYFATKSKSEPYKIFSRTQILDEQQIKIENNIVQLKKSLKLLKNSYKQRLVNKEKFQFESNKIKEEVADLTEEKENIEDRIEAINNLEDEFSNLEKLLEQKFIESSEYESKVEELIENYIENYL